MTLRQQINVYSPYKFHNKSHLMTCTILIVSLLDHCFSYLFCRNTKKAKRARENLPYLNEYDLAKCLGLIFMLIDHRSYFGVRSVFGETMTWEQLHWCRVIGRGTSPLFFWAAGYSNSFRFRWPTFFFAVLMVAEATHLNLELAYTPFETVVEVLALNVIYKYWPSKKMTGLVDKWWFHITAFILAYSAHSWLNHMVQMQYGSYALMISFSGLLAARHSRYATPWVVGSMVIYWDGALSFCRTDLQTFGCLVIIASEATWMYYFRNREIHIPNFLGKVIRDMSRNAIFYYVIHMCFFRMIVMKESSEYRSQR